MWLCMGINTPNVAKHPVCFVLNSEGGAYAWSRRSLWSGNESPFGTGHWGSFETTVIETHIGAPETTSLGWPSLEGAAAFQEGCGRSLTRKQSHLELQQESQKIEDMR